MSEKTEPWQAAYQPSGDTASKAAKPGVGAIKTLPRQPFNLMLFGIFFALFNFHINGLQLLPDGLGYLLIAFGAGALANYSSKFATTKVLSFVLLAIWIVGFIVQGGPVGYAYGAASSLVVCLLVWHLLGGIRELAIKGQRPDLAKLAEIRRLLFVIIFGGLALITKIPDAQFMAPMAFGSVIAIVVLTILIIHLIFKTRSIFAPN